MVCTAPWAGSCLVKSEKPKRNSRLGRKPAIFGALGSVACAISDAHSHRGGDTHEFPASPERVLKGLGVSPAGEER